MWRSSFYCTTALHKAALKSRPVSTFHVSVNRGGREACCWLWPDLDSFSLFNSLELPVSVSCAEWCKEPHTLRFMHIHFWPCAVQRWGSDGSIAYFTQMHFHLFAIKAQLEMVWKQLCFLCSFHNSSHPVFPLSEWKHHCNSYFWNIFAKIRKCRGIHKYEEGER